MYTPQNQIPGYATGHKYSITITVCLQ